MNELTDTQLIALQRCIDALADFANYERWQMLDYLAARYARTKYVMIHDNNDNRQLGEV